MTVNGFPSVCTDNCEYRFLSNTPEITSQSLSGSVVSVAISNPTGVNYDTDMLIVKVDGQNCRILSGTFTSFTCQLPTNPNSSPVLKAGQYNV